ncbi:MFS transporter [Rhodococcus qingshengii]|uniref:MFS transporter n=1 Tax=Rhodococcus qingshengii TaxID=334542 RepID=UPI0022B55B4F|nr:MFS transporter [Rhodococcus qingshengii]MCZ4618618.1 MFS transporter [Rhodococcus qingshengii]
MSLREQMDSGAMSRHQWGTVALCVLLNIVDGFDILVMSFTSNSVTEEWGLSGSQLGTLLSAGLIGMALGSLFVAPWADRVGRRPLVLGCLALVTVGMLASAAAQAPWQLALLRAITGLGMGGIIVSANVIASEFASARWRGLAVSLNTVGYPFGAMMGGVVAVVLQSHYSWRAVFVFGAIMTAVSFVILAIRLPESVDILYLSQSPDALAKINTLALKMEKNPVLSLDSTSVLPLPEKPGLRELLTPRNRRVTLILASGFFLTMFGFYFVQSWTPRLLVTAGLSENQGNIGGTMLNVGGMLGSALLGYLAARISLRFLLVSFLTLSGVLLCALALSTSSLVAAFSIAVLIGMFANGCMAGLYAVSTGAYEARIRATAVGAAVTVGRTGAIVAPLVAGILVDLSWSTLAIYAIMSLPFFLAASVVSRLGAAHRNSSEAATDVSSEARARHLRADTDA